MHEPDIVEVDLPEGLLGLTDGHSTIWLDRYLTDEDRRVVLAHEWIHFERGHNGHCLGVVEHGIDREVACRLIPIDALCEAAAWSQHLCVIADELAVMPETVEHRLHALTQTERQALETRTAEAYWAH